MPSSYLLSLNPPNDPLLVRLLKVWLNALGIPDARAPLDVSTPFDRATHFALRTFQRANKLPANGICNLCTWQLICRQVSRQAHAGLVNHPALVNYPDRRWLINLLNNRHQVEGGKITVDRTLFMMFYRTEEPPAGTHKKNVASIINKLLDSFAKANDVTDIKQAALTLARETKEYHSVVSEADKCFFEAIIRACLKN